MGWAEAGEGRRRLRRPAITIVGLVCALSAVGGVWIAQNTGRQRSAAPTATNRSSRATLSAPATTTTAPPPTTTAPPPTTTSPGWLPQTATLPTTTSPIFSANVAALWDGVSTGSAQNAVPAFFPESAYLQLKTIPGAQNDFNERLVAEYEEDVSAAHQLLGPAAAVAKLVGVDVDGSYAHWVPVGTCDNDVGYFEVPNSRVVYSINGQVSSFGIASMISWRGEWYIVHLGAILRSGGGGEVDEPVSGPGRPTYSSTC